MENSTAENAHGETVDPDLGELFKEDWNVTEAPRNLENSAPDKNHTESQSKSSSGLTESQSIDPDNLDELFQDEWSYKPTVDETLEAFGTASSSTRSWQSTGYNYSSALERQKAAVVNFIDSYLTDVQKGDKYRVLEIVEDEITGAFGILLNSDYELVPLNEQEQTALHLIFYKGAWELLLVLDEKFTDSDYPATSNSTNLKDRNGLSHLHVACTRGSPSLVERYLSNNGDVNVCYSGDPSDGLGLGWFSVCGGFTPLHFAVINLKMCKKEIVTKLIERGANVNAVDSRGRTPLHIASRIFQKQNVTSDRMINLEVMDILIKHQCDVDVRDADGNTPLLSAFSLHYGEYRMGASSSDVFKYMTETKRKLQFFLEHGADLTSANEKNENVLHRILKNLKMCRLQCDYADYIFDDSDHMDMINQVLTANPKIDLNMKNDQGDTPLRMAVACMSSKIVELLLDHGADLKSLKFEGKGRRGAFFCYPDLVAIFEPIQDLMNVLDLLGDRGFNLSLKDSMIVLTFLLHDGEYCKCVNDSYSNIKLLLHYGAKSHVEEVLNRLQEDFDRFSSQDLLDSDDDSLDSDVLEQKKDERLHCLGGLDSDFSKYLNTSKLGNILIDTNIKKLIENIMEEVLSREFDSTFNKKHGVEKELIRLKAIKFENDVSLHDILVKDPQDTPRWIVNDFDLKLIKNLKYYKDAVKGHITKARVRYLFEKYSSDYLKLIYDTLPDVCCRMIVNYLDNKDILNLCLATTIEN